MRTPIPDHIKSLARGSDPIDYKALDYAEWLALQHQWMLDRLDLSDDDPLAIALRALDKIARLPVNGSGSDAYWTARIALEATGGWPPAED